MNSNFTITYRYVPFLEVIVMQDAIEKLGHIGPLNVTHINITSNDGKVLFLFPNLIRTVRDIYFQ